MILLSTSDTSDVCYSKMWLFAIQITSLDMRLCSKCLFEPKRLLFLSSCRGQQFLPYTQSEREEIPVEITYFGQSFLYMSATAFQFPRTFHLFKIRSLENTFLFYKKSNYMGLLCTRFFVRVTYRESAHVFCSVSHV